MEIAYRIYPWPNGTVYTEKELTTIDDVVGLFDYCQILDACISKKGWEYLINIFGYEKLYEADKISGWFDLDTLEEFIEEVKYQIENIAYDNAG